LVEEIVSTGATVAAEQSAAAGSGARASGS
jgi:hypothetical protein